MNIFLFIFLLLLPWILIAILAISIYKLMCIKIVEDSRKKYIEHVNMWNDYKN
jgi:hypothetical protein